MAISVAVFVGDSGKWVEEDLVAKVKNLKIGPGWDESTDIAPLNSK